MKDRVAVAADAIQARRIALARRWAGQMLAPRRHAAGPHSRRGYDRRRKKAEDRKPYCDW